MEKKNYKTANYTVAIELAKSPNDVFNHVINLKKWWPEDFEGDDIKLNSEFVFSTGDSHYSKNKVIEFVPDKKLVWLATEGIRKTDNFEWTGTKMIFELTPKGDNTLLKFTYDGVVLENESDRLVQICDMTVKEMFYNFIVNGKGKEIPSQIKMENKNFTATIEVSKSPQSVFKSITNDVTKWWGGKDLEGKSINLNDEFIINHPGAHYSKQKLVEVVPGKKIVWLVTDSTLYWLKKDQHEWANTKMIFEITTKGDKTVLHFTHKGLVPEKECHAMCEQGWNMVIKDWLFNFINAGIDHFQESKMKQQSYTASFEIVLSPKDVFSHINDVSKWWAKAAGEASSGRKTEFEGQSTKLNDEFIVRSGDRHYSKQKLIEVIPDKKVVWLVTESKLNWLEKNKDEWTNTKMVFEITSKGDKTILNFTHEGLIPEHECYSMCAPGWDIFIKQRLYNFMINTKF